MCRSPAERMPADEPQCPDRAGDEGREQRRQPAQIRQQRLLPAPDDQRARGAWRTWLNAVVITLKVIDATMLDASRGVPAVRWTRNSADVSYRREHEQGHDVAAGCGGAPVTGCPSTPDAAVRKSTSVAMARVAHSNPAGVLSVKKIRPRLTRAGEARLPVPPVDEIAHRMTKHVGEHAQGVGVLLIHRATAPACGSTVAPRGGAPACGEAAVAPEQGLERGAPGAPGRVRRGRRRPSAGGAPSHATARRCAR